MLTHLVFGAGSAAALSLMLPTDLRLFLAPALSLLVNPVIDEFGHVVRRGYAVRSPLTHSVFTAPLWGGAVGYIVWAAGSSLGVMSPGLESVSVLFGAVVAISHLLLDSMTEGGVFVLTRPVALAHFGNSNLLLNGAFVVLGLMLFLA